MKKPVSPGVSVWSCRLTHKKVIQQFEIEFSCVTALNKIGAHRPPTRVAVFPPWPLILVSDL